MKKHNNAWTEMGRIQWALHQFKGFPKRRWVAFNAWRKGIYWGDIFEYGFPVLAIVFVLSSVSALLYQIFIYEPTYDVSQSVEHLIDHGFILQEGEPFTLVSPEGSVIITVEGGKK